MVDDTGNEVGGVDPDDHLARTCALHERATSLAAGSSIELYSRNASTLRIGIELEGAPPGPVRGTEDGLALRVRTSDGQRVGFAATSGRDEASLCRVIDSMSAAGGPLIAATGIWPRATGKPLLDRESTLELPSREYLATWLERARTRLDELGGHKMLSVADCRVEVAVTVESWCSDGGHLGSRTRARAWALARLRGLGGPSPLARPIMIASRRWQGLPVEGWSRILEDRCIPPGPAAHSLPSRCDVLFNPEASAAVVQALVRAMYTPDQDPDLPAGPGWRLSDEPALHQALFGGTFDDIGFPTRATLLGDGKRCAVALQDTGRFRRPSFRDPPTPMASHLVVRAAGGAPTPGTVLASDVAIHALDPDAWILEIEGALLEGGRPTQPVRGATIRATPAELIRRCVAGLGEPRDSHLGVTTPALLFENLDLRT